MSTFNAGAPFAPETSGQDGDKENSSKSKKAHDAWREQYEQKQEAKAHSLISSQIAKDEQKDKQEKAQKAEKKESPRQKVKRRSFLSLAGKQLAGHREAIRSAEFDKIDKTKGEPSDKRLLEISLNRSRNIESQVYEQVKFASSNEIQSKQFRAMYESMGGVEIADDIMRTSRALERTRAILVILEAKKDPNVKFLAGIVASGEAQLQAKLGALDEKGAKEQAESESFAKAKEIISADKRKKDLEQKNDPEKKSKTEQLAEQDKEDPRQLRKDRVYYHEKIKAVKKRIKKLQEKEKLGEPLSEEERKVLGSLQTELTEYLLLQAATLKETKISPTDHKANMLDLLTGKDKSHAETIVEIRRFLPNALPQEKARLEKWLQYIEGKGQPELNAFFATSDEGTGDQSHPTLQKILDKVRAKSNIEDQTQEVQKYVQEMQEKYDDKRSLSDDLEEFMEYAAHPELIGRIEITANKDINPTMKDLLAEMQDYEEWKRDPKTIEERINAFKIEALETVLVSEDDELDLDDKEIEQSIKDLAESYGFTTEGSLEATANQGTEINEIIERMKNINAKRKNAISLIEAGEQELADLAQGTEKASEIDVQDFELGKQKKLLDNLVLQLEASVSRARSKTSEKTGPNIEQRKNALSKLLDSGHLEFRVTPTGLTIVIDNYGIQSDESDEKGELKKDISYLYSLLGADANTKETIAANLSQKSLVKFFGQEEYKGRFTNPNQLPSINIIIAQGITNEEENKTRHEIFHSLQEEFLRETKSANNAEERAVYEFASMLMEGRGAVEAFTPTDQLAYRTKLSHLYLDKPNVDDSGKGKQEEMAKLETHLSITQLITQVEKLIAEKRKNSAFSELDEMLLRMDISSFLVSEFSALKKKLEVSGQATQGTNQTEELYNSLIERLMQNYDIPADQKVGRLNGNQLINKANQEYETTLKPAQKALIEAGLMEFSNRKAKSPYVGTENFTGAFQDQRSLGKLATDITEGRYHPNPDIMKTRRGNFFYDPEGNAFTTWNELVGRGPRIPFTHKRIGKLFHVPRVGNLPMPGLSMFMPRGYGSAGRAFGAYFSRAPFGSRRRAMAERHYNPYVGADFSKFGKMINPGLEYMIREHFPGIWRQYSVGKEYEKLPVQMAYNSLEQWSDIGNKLVFGVLTEEMKMHPQTAMRIVGALPGRRFEFDLERKSYGFKPAMEADLSLFDQGFDHDTQKHALERMLGEVKEVMTNEDPDDILTNDMVKMRYDAEGEKPKRNAVGTLTAPARTLLGPMLLPTGPSKYQKKKADWFKEYASRKDLSWVQNQQKWEMEIGSKAREYWQMRDGVIMLSAMKAESDHTLAEKGKHFSLFDLTNLVYRAESMDDERTNTKNTWQRNTSKETMLFDIVENGKKRTMEILPGDFMLDEHGNLIPGLAEGEYDKKQRKFVANLKKGETEIYWQHIVGDRENPHLRFIKLNSQDGLDIARGIAGDDDIQKAGENIRLRTDGIKWAMKMIEEQELKDVMANGIAPTRRYKTDFLRDANDKVIIDPASNEGYDIPFLTENFKNQTGVTSLFDTNAKVDSQFMNAFNQRVQALTKDLPVLARFGLNANDSQQEVAGKIRDLMASLRGIRGGDEVFKDLIEFDADPSWASPYREELQGILPMSPNILKTWINTHNEGYHELQRRLEVGRGFYFQWMSRYAEVSHNERRQYKLTTFYKGLEAFMKWGANWNMMISFGLLLATGNPAFFNYAFLPSFLTKMYGKPFAARRAARAHARRLKSLEAQEKLMSLQGLYAKIEAGDIITRAEEKMLFSKNEALVYMAEDVGATKEAKDWEEKEDMVQRSWGKFLSFLDEKYGKAA